jgi:serine/threonine-protein kinase
LGCTFYYFLTGELPFKGDSVLKLILAKEQGKHESVRKLNPEIPDRLSLMVDKMIQKEAKHRYSSCAEIIADLEKLGLENETLSIIDGADAAGGGRSARTRSRSTVSATGAGATNGGAGQTMPGYRTSEEDATASEQKSSSQDKVVWYVRFTNKKGEAQVKEMMTRQVQQGILAEALDVKAQAQKKGQGGGFLALAAYDEFQALMKKRLAKTTEVVRSDHMKDMYAKLDKEQTRRKRWRWLKNMTESVLGGFGLIVYLAIVVVVVVAIYWVVTEVIYPKISENLEDRPPVVEPDPDAE